MDDIRTIWLAGDSLVQQYRQEEFIGGWGEYLEYYLKPGKFRIENRAKGGRSARFYINEGRFLAFRDDMREGDFLFIEFCHNDDATKEYKTMPHRLTPLGTPDINGVYPIIPGKLVSKDFLPYEYIKALYEDSSKTVEEKEAELEEINRIFREDFYSDTYYPYSSDGSKGTYKWFLKYFCDEARKRGAVPIIVTAPPRTVFENGSIKDGPSLHGGNDFAYIRAARQLAVEENVMLIDLFEKCRELFERLGERKTKYLNTIKIGQLTGKWPEDFDCAVSSRGNIPDNTHFNKFGAFILAGLVVEEMSNFDIFKDHVNKKPSYFVPCPKVLADTFF